MRNKLLPVILIGLLLSCLILGGCMAKPNSGQEGVKYTLYIGLNDKDTYTQLVSTEEAVKKVSAIALKHADGFTLYQGQGAYLDDQGVETFENCLVLEFFDLDETKVRVIMDEVIKELNQSSILVEREKVNYEFYEGTAQ